MKRFPHRDHRTKQNFKSIDKKISSNLKCFKKGRNEKSPKVMRSVTFLSGLL